MTTVNLNSRIICIPDHPPRRWRDTKMVLRHLGIVAKYSDEWEEFQVGPPNNEPARYYTDDEEDAYHTGLRMVEALLLERNRTRV